MSKTILGLDLGITSIGWALIRSDDIEHTNNEILDCGVRIFQVAEHPKDGKSLALPRREARSARRITKRRAQRMRAVKRLLVRHHLITPKELEIMFNAADIRREDVWKLREQALSRVLTSQELVRVLIHIAKHRGYFSNRKSEQPTDSEGKAVLSGIAKNEEVLHEKKYCTIGEYMATKQKKRNGKDATGKLNYENSIARSMLVDEVETIFGKQQEFGNEYVSEGMLEQYKAIAFTQHPLKSVEGLVGRCPFEVDELRAPKAAHTFEKFRALQKLKNLRMMTEAGEASLSFEQMQQAIVIAKKSKTFTYKTLKSKLGIDKTIMFKGLTYFDHKTGEMAKKDPEKVNLIDFGSYHSIKESVQSVDNLLWDEMENDDCTLDEIARVLSTEKDDKKAFTELQKVVVNEAVCNALLAISFSGFGHLSIKALKNIVPYLEKGLDYDKACEEAGYDFKAVFKGDKTLLLPPLSAQEQRELTNPVVKRAVSQMRLVYNAIARKHGEIDAVHIELARDIKKSHKERNDIQKEQADYRERKEEARIHAKEIMEKEPSAKELLKFRLWQEQNQFCIYSGQRIEPSDIMDPYATEVDHILPYSRSLDDSLNNKVLCLTKENQNKGRQTPFEYFGADTESEQWHWFSQHVNGFKNLKQAKKRRLLKTNFDESSENGFKERNKTDTSYIASFIKNYIEAHIAFRPSKMKRHVFTMNGALTAQLRYKWGVGDKNRENHLHHAEDAMLLAFATQSQVQKLSTVSAQREGFVFSSKEEKAKRVKFDAPMDNFHEWVKASVQSIFVSHMPRRKVTGAAHEATVYSPKTLSVKKEKGKVDCLKGSSVKNNVALKHGIAKNDAMPRVDLFQHKRSKKYFLVPVYVSDFVKDQLPNKAIVPSGKPWLEMDMNYEFLFSLFKNDLLEIKTKKTAKKESIQVLGYFEGAHSGTAQIIIRSHDGAEEYGFGSQNLVFIKKYQVDPLGNYVEIEREKRVGTQKELAQAKKARQP